MQSKNILRKQYLIERKNTSKQQKEAIDSAITCKVTEHPWFQKAQVIFVYVSTEDEISTKELIHKSWAEGKTVCVPKCMPKRQMQARQIKSYSELTEKTFGILEPDKSCPEILPQHIDLCIVPALACDERGYRLGYGGGFYDRFLPKTDCKKLALCASSRLLKYIETEGTDVRCDGVVTEFEVIHT